MEAHYAKPVSSTKPPSMVIHRIVVALYAVLSAAAVGRSSYQILTKLEEAPLAYSLSGVAALVYVVATVAVALSARSRLRVLAFGTVGFELLGVLGIGALSVVRPELFPEATVWSHFGAGYVFIPLVLPAVGLWWLTQKARTP
jgi:hypothetical protein